MRLLVTILLNQGGKHMLLKNDDIMNAKKSDGNERGIVSSRIISFWDEKSKFVFWYLLFR